MARPRKMDSTSTVFSSNRALAKECIYAAKDVVRFDNEFSEFYEEKLKDTFNCTFDEYIIDKIEDSFENIINDIMEFKKLLVGRIWTTRSRWLKSSGIESFEGRVFFIPGSEDKRYDRLVGAFDNELLLEVVNNAIDYLFTNRIVVERINSLSGFFSAREQNMYFNINNKIAIENGVDAALSDLSFENENGLAQPFYIIPNENLESMIVSKNDIPYLKSKSLDFKDQLLMDFLVSEYKKVMYLSSKSMEFSTRELQSIIYKQVTKKNDRLIINRLQKMASMGFRTLPDDSINISDFGIVRMFELNVVTKENGTIICKIGMSNSITEDLMKNNTLKLYKHKLDEIQDDFTSILVNILQSHRIDCTLSKDQPGKLDSSSGYDFFMAYSILSRRVFLPFKTRAKNFEIIKSSLNQLKELGFIIQDYKVRTNGFNLKFIDMTTSELRTLGLEDKIKDLGIYIE